MEVRYWRAFFMDQIRLNLFELCIKIWSLIKILKPKEPV